MRLVAWRNRKPRLGLGEAGILLVVPLHRGALAVTSFFFRPSLSPNRILHIFLTCRWSGCHSDLLSVVHDRSSAQGEIESCHEFCDLVVVLAVAVPVVGANDIVITDH